MSKGITYLHSHSNIERNVKELLIDKFHVLIDEEFKHIFDDLTHDIKPFVYNNKKYYRVPTYYFYKKGGVFKNLSA